MANVGATVVGILPIVLGILAGLIFVLPSLHQIGPTEVGLVIKKFSSRKLPEDNPIAFKGEAGYQAKLLMPGLRFKFWILYKVKKFPWVQVPAGEIGVVIAQVGRPLPIGAKSAEYHKDFGNFTNLENFVARNGQKGVQRPVLPPGTIAPIHPVGFLVITKKQVYGLPIDPEIKNMADRRGVLAPDSFGLNPAKLEVVRIEPKSSHDGQTVDRVGIITVFEGQPLDSGDIASRLGGFTDLRKLEEEKAGNSQLIEMALGTKNGAHNNYQDFQAFIDSGGRIGLQHDPLLYGAYNLNPFLVNVEMTDMLVVEQGEVAVIKAYVGLGTEDTSGAEFKFGSLVRPGHRGIWEEPLRTGKYAINPHCYKAEHVPTAILTLNWAEAESRAHQLDKELKQIVAKSKEGFIFKIDLQVQIHVPDTEAPKVISIVGTMQNLVNEVLQAAVGNHFRDKIQSMEAIQFIEQRQKVQELAMEYIKGKIQKYNVETRGVYIQDVVLPSELVTVLTQREIANQEVETYEKQKAAQEKRIETEKAKGTADMQAELAKSKVGVDIKTNNAKARKKEADGDAYYTKETGAVKGSEVESVGLALARAYREQREALGGGEMVALVNIMKALAEKRIEIVPQVQVNGSGNAGEGLMALIMNSLANSITTKSRSDKKDDSSE